ncbi:MAG: ATP-binding cassette domain-containing protein [Candidatus Bathyarchaeia archaeon]|nr:ATP-binding cassette domain-containing protein [Candidatus Bathyarchaeota archaeon]
MSEFVLETEKLEKIYRLGGRSIRALSDVNLKVKRGDFVSIMGPSGSGKTTLLNILGCLDRPTGGKVILDGVDVTLVPEKELYKIRRYKVGFIFQTFNLLPYLSALENVELPMEGTGKSKEEMRKRARELLRLVGLAERENHKPLRLSAGEQQRVAIARALANDPAIILADEPTGNLDAKTKYEIIRLLGKLNVEQGTTIVMVTHDSAIASHARRVLFLSDGKLLTKEKMGLLAKEKLACPACGREVQVDHIFCPHCGRKL